MNRAISDNSRRKKGPELPSLMMQIGSAMEMHTVGL